MAEHSAGVVASFDEIHYRREVDRRPKSGQLRYEFALALAANDDPAAAVEQCSKALALQPKLKAAAKLLASLLQRYAINPSINISPQGLEAAFAFIDVDRQALGNAAIAFLKSRPPLTDLLTRGREDGWNTATAPLLGREGQKLLKNRLFRAALNYSVNIDPEIELLLTALRQHFLLSPASLSARHAYEFACVMIQQCHNNDYVFLASDRERTHLGELSVDLSAIFNGETEQLSNFLRISLYRPLQETVTTAYAARGFDKVYPRALRPVLKACLETRLAEAMHAEKVFRRTAITDHTSQRVANQYTGDPYPRWLSMQTPESGSASAQLEDHFPAEYRRSLDGPCNVLIAGAGTCEQAICSAIAYGPKARVLAFDLSATSLAYGMRMAAEYGVENISFAQGDILRIEELAQNFDVIECGGVLHHMEKPYEAWRLLTNHLRPGGLMQIGLYSAISRQVIRSLTKAVDWPGSSADEDELRSFRGRLLRGASNEPGAELTNSVDFHTKSGFRDLILHVNEHQCTLPEIRDFMQENELNFHGFVLPAETLSEYSAQFNERPIPGTLCHWQSFEETNSRTFDAMYLFWCRKADPSKDAISSR